MAQMIKKNPSMMYQLKKSSFLKDIKENTLQRLYELGIFRMYQRGESVLQERKKCSYICFLLSGKAVEYNITLHGKRKIFFILGPGELLNDRILDNKDSSIYCDVIEPSKVLMIPKAAFIELMARDYALNQAVFRDQEGKLVRLRHQLKNSVGNINMDRKIAAKLWKLARDFGIPKDKGVEIDISLSVTFLADMIGTSRESVSRILTDLLAKELICYEKKRITVCDVDRLSHYFKTGDVR